MIIPIRCYTCNKVLADKWEYYKKRVDQLENENKKNKVEKKEEDLEKAGIKKSVNGKVLDELELTRICCRRSMLSHVDLIDLI